MKTIKQRYLMIPLFSLSLLMSGCANHETIAVSDVHGYDTSYGLDSNPTVDRQIESEPYAQNSVTETTSSMEDDGDLVMEPGTFLAEDYVPTPPKITYKYKFDEKFYDKAEWRSAKD